MASAYRPPRWLRNPHVQSVLSSMPLRRAAGLRELRRLGAHLWCFNPHRMSHAMQSAPAN